jgi:hypothetical protein
MEAMFTKMMEGCLKGMSAEDQEKMMACGAKMAAMCPCMGTKELSDEDRRNMMDKMMAFCGSKLMSACCTKTESSSVAETGSSEKA